VRLVVADTGPRNYLIQIGCVCVCVYALADLVETVVLPSLVVAELAADGAPVEVRAWASALPPWIEERNAVVAIGMDLEISPADREAITLAVELNSVLLMDDRRALKAAREKGVLTVGTIGILEAVAAKGLVSLPAAFDRLRRTGMFISEELLNQALIRDRRRQGIRNVTDPDSNATDELES